MTFIHHGMNNGSFLFNIVITFRTVGRSLFTLKYNGEIQTAKVPETDEATTEPTIQFCLWSYC